MNIHKMKVEHRFYYPLYNFLCKHLAPRIEVKDCKDDGIILILPRKFCSVVGVSEDSEKLLFHVFGVHYILFEYYYNEDY